MCQIEKLESLIKTDIAAYWESYIGNLDKFLSEISLDDEFNFTYIFLTILRNEFRTQYFSYLEFYTSKYWLNRNDEFNISGKYLYLGLSEDELLKFDSLVNAAFEENIDKWISKYNFIDNYDFNLLVDYDSSFKILSKFNKDMVGVLNGKVYNVKGWWEFIKYTVLGILDGFEADDSNFTFFKKYSCYIVVIKLEPSDLLNVNYLLKNMGRFNFGLTVYLEDVENKLIKKFPTEISGVAHELMFKNYSMSFKNASHEEAKIRVYANTTAFCNLILVLLNGIEKLMVNS